MRKWGTRNAYKQQYDNNCNFFSKSFPLKNRKLLAVPYCNVFAWSTKNNLKTGYINWNCVFVVFVLQIAHTAHCILCEMSHRLRFLICDIDHNDVTGNRACVRSVDCGYTFIFNSFKLHWCSPVCASFVCLLPFVLCEQDVCSLCYSVWYLILLFNFVFVSFYLRCHLILLTSVN